MLINQAAAKRYSAAGIASFFIPGLGQIMKGQVLTAIGIWACVVVCVLLMFFGGLLFLAVLWAAQVGDAFKSPDRLTKAMLLQIGRRRGWRS